MSFDYGSAFFKTLLLSIMVIQNSSTVLVGKFTRSSVPTGQRYEVAHMMIVTEFLKLVLSSLMECSLSGYSSVLSSFSYSSLQIAPPALLYLIQNSFIYISLAYLSVPTFQVLYQSKLIMTALLSTALLNHTYNSRQWSGLLLLTAGVTVVTLSEGRNEGGTNQGKQSDTAFGVGLVLIACVCSSLAGIYFEALIKNITNPCFTCSYCFCCDRWKLQSVETSTNVGSVWVRNIQLSAFTLLIAFAQELFLHFPSMHGMDDGSQKSYRGFFTGFTPWVYLQILLLGGGGLIVAAVIKYTDNVQKGMATGVSVVFSSILSNLIFGTNLSIHFTVGATLVILGLILFSDDMSSFCLSKRNIRRILLATLLTGICSFSIHSHFLLSSKQKDYVISLLPREHFYPSPSSLDASRNGTLSGNHSVIPT